MIKHGSARSMMRFEAELADIAPAEDPELVRQLAPQAGTSSNFEREFVSSSLLTPLKRKDIVVV